MSDLSKVVILIPSFEPDEKLPKVLNDLQGYPFEKILIVNDGSDKKFDTVFDECRVFPDVEVIGYEENKGKGFALKKGFRYIQEHYPDFKAIVTADSDGQHTPEDIRRTAQTTLENPEKLILGSRSWKEENVPFRSRYGNKITKAVFKWISGTKVEDTQTGLRGFSPDVVSEFLKTKGDRFEYEMNMLMEARLRHIEILEIPIETVYIEENKSSHFRPFRDSVKIYSVFFKHLSKFVISSMSATVIDFAIYAIMLNAVFGYTEENTSFLDNLTDYRIVISFIVARILSSAFNFIINKYVVFKERKRNPKEVAKYYAIVVVVFLCTVLLNSFFLTIGVAQWLCQPLATFIMFFISYYFQRVIVFK